MCPSVRPSAAAAAAAAAAARGRETNISNLITSLDLFLVPFVVVVVVVYFFFVFLFKVKDLTRRGPSSLTSLGPIYFLCRRRRCRPFWFRPSSSSSSSFTVPTPFRHREGNSSIFSPFFFVSLNLFHGRDTKRKEESICFFFSFLTCLCVSLRPLRGNKSTAHRFVIVAYAMYI